MKDFIIGLIIVLVLFGSYEYYKILTYQEDSSSANAYYSSRGKAELTPTIRKQLGRGI